MPYYHTQLRLCLYCLTLNHLYFGPLFYVRPTLDKKNLGSPK